MRKSQQGFSVLVTDSDSGATNLTGLLSEFRITEESEPRITEEGDNRITESTTD